MRLKIMYIWNHTIKAISIFEEITIGFYGTGWK